MWEIRESNGFKVGLAWIGEDLQGKGRYLISAVEELYECCIDLLDEYEGGGDVDDGLVSEVRAVLAQARGEG